MPLIKELRETPVVVGIICDRCGNELNEAQVRAGAHHYIIEHTFGYDSVADMTTVTACICDNCRLQIILENVPGAVFTNEGFEVDKEDLALRLADHINKKPFDPRR